MEAPLREIIDEDKARQLTPEVLDRLHDDALSKIIADNLDRRTCASLLWDNLTSAAVIARTIRILKGMARSANGDLERREVEYHAQVAGRPLTRETSEAGVKYLGWRTRAMAFRDLVDYRLSSAALAAARVFPDGEFAGQRGKAWESNHKLLALLAAALQEHQNALGDGFGDLDLDLYRFLDEYVTIAGGQMTLREWAASVGQLPGRLARAS